MKAILIFCLFQTICLHTNAQRKATQIEKVASFMGQQVTGVTVSDQGRIFTSFPRWRNTVENSVVEVRQDGSFFPYPDRHWNEWRPGLPVSDSVFVAVQSVLAFNDKLYVLDTRNPLWKGVVDTPRIFVFNIANYQLEDILLLSENSYKSNSYTNDLRIDQKHGAIYMTDSNAPGLIIYDLKTRKSRRVLDAHYSTSAETSSLTIDGKKWGDNPVHSDGIALNKQKERLYYHALHGYTLYSIPTQALRSESDEMIEASVKKEMVTPAPDGMIFDHKGNLYLGDLEKHKIVALKPNGKLVTICEGEKVGWPDTFSIYQGYLYFTNSRIHEANNDVSNLEFMLYRVKID